MAITMDREELLERVPPYHIEAEQSVIAAMIVDNQTIPVAAEILSKRDFYRPDHTLIFETILNLTSESTPIDPITLTDRLRDMGKLDDGMALYIMNTISLLPSSSSVRHYANIVKDKADLRKLASISRDIHSLCYGKGSAREVSDIAVQKLLELQITGTSKYIHVSEMVNEIHEEFGEALAGNYRDPGIMTGIKEVDNITYGFHPGLNIVAGRISHGKTALLLQIARNCTKPIILFSLETTAKSITRRLITAGSGISSKQIRKGDVDDEEITILYDTMSTVHNMPIYIADKHHDISRIVALSNVMKLQYDISAVMVDYLQLVQSTGSKFGNREQEVSYIARSLHNLSMQLEIPVIAAAQLRRLPEGRRIKKPILEDLRESGEIEQAAYLVMLLHNPKPEDDNGSPREASINIAKHKDGMTGEVHVMWEGRRLTYHDMEMRQQL
jgi:replicative DNA helicase